MGHPATAASRAPAARPAARYERKFRIEETDLPRVLAVVRAHPALFGVLHPPRHVNNIYLDSPFLDCFSDNVQGHGDRHKVRIRWYGELFGEIARPVLEIKIKRGLVGWKEQYPLRGFSLGPGFAVEALRQVLGRSDLPPVLASRLAAGGPTLLNRYLRRYYATPDRRFRLTVDTGLTFYPIGRRNNRFLRRQVDRDAVIVELKYAPEHEPQAARITAAFPFRVTKSSKYVQGVERVSF